MDGLDAVRQTVRIALSVERYHWRIHSWQFGVELSEIDFNRPKGMLYPSENPFA